MNRAQQGIWSGVLATGPMTLVMFGLHQWLSAMKKSPLPPATLTSQITSQVGIDQKLDTDQRENLTMLAHFGYGAACGLLYSILLGRTNRQSIWKGPLFGIGIWAVSYLGWTPALGLRANAFRMPAQRNGLMIFAHLVWGGCLSLSETALRQFGNQMLDGHRKALLAE